MDLAFPSLILLALCAAIPAWSQAPQAGQIDFEVTDLPGAVQPTSFVQVRENAVAGTRLSLGPDLGLNQLQMPAVELTYWFNSRSAVLASWRGFFGSASRFESGTINYNGSTLSQQEIQSKGVPWYSASAYYERRFSPWSDAAGANAFEKNLDLRAGLGLEYTHLMFYVNPAGAGGEDFYLQELPIPTLRLEAREPLGLGWSAEGLLKLNAISRWDSLRTEVGTVYLTQEEFEAHLRLVYANEKIIKGLEAIVGVVYYDYRQGETSIEDGNYIRVVVLGPELGLRYHF